MHFDIVSTLIIAWPPFVVVEKSGDYLFGFPPTFLLCVSFNLWLVSSLHEYLFLLDEMVLKKYFIASDFASF